ncbi:YMGG-like glycine zipper-containing protein, partial [Candidatus Omnitrophota bacterium]
MKRTVVAVLCLFLALAVVGCQTNKTRVGEGTVIGGILGAAAGGIIGHQSGHGGEGAAIGAATGALGGALVGSQIEKPGQEAASTSSQQAVSADQMSLQQVVDLSKQGAHEDVIIDRI